VVVETKQDEEGLQFHGGDSIKEGTQGRVVPPVLKETLSPKAQQILSNQYDLAPSRDVDNFGDDIQVVDMPLSPNHQQNQKK